MGDDTLLSGAPDQTGIPAGEPGDTPPANIPPTPDGTPTSDGASDSNKPDEGKPAEDAPESYEDFTLPEGYTIDDARNTEFSEFAKSNNMTQDQAQQAIDLYTKMQQEDAERFATALADRKNEWETTVKNDEEIGGADFDKKVAIASRALTEFGSDELKQALSETGLGSHPEMVRFAYKVGLTLPEDDQPGGERKNVSEAAKDILYPKAET